MFINFKLVNVQISTSQQVLDIWFQFQFIRLTVVFEFESNFQLHEF